MSEDRPTATDKPTNPFSASEALLESAGVIAPDPAKRPKVRLSLVISTLAETVGRLLGTSPHKLFLRGDTVMTIAFDHSRGDIDFAPISEAAFVSWVESYIDFGVESVGHDEHGVEQRKWVSRSIQPKTAKLILESLQFRNCLPRVMRQNRVRLPVLRAPLPGSDRGKIELLPSGYDQESGVFTFPSNVVINESVTIGQALAYLLDLYEEFPLPLVTVGEGPDAFVRRCPRGMGACIASAMALFVEGLLPRNTLRLGFFFNANLPRSGKSLLGKIAMTPVTGAAAGLPLSRNEETLKSHVDSTLLNGQSVVFFDNVKGHIDSQIIEALMTMPTWQGRTMHTQRVFWVKNETTILISGNNATTSDDMMKRFVWINLQSESSDPSDAHHSREIDDAWLCRAENRSEILSALWAMVRHWDEGGRPGVDKWAPGFKAWSDVVGGIVTHAGHVVGGAISNPLEAPKISESGGNEAVHMCRLVRALVIEEMRKRLAAAMGKAEGDRMEDIEDDRVIRACATRRIAIDRAEYTPGDVARVAMENSLFDWFLPELVEGRDAADLLKQPERVKFGRIITARSGEYPRGMKYALTIGEHTAVWRFNQWRQGRHKRYVVEPEAHR